MNIASSSLSTVAALALFAGGAACLVACSETNEKKAGDNTSDDKSKLQAPPTKLAQSAFTALDQVVKLCEIDPSNYQPLNCQLECSASPATSTPTPPCEIKASAAKIVQAIRITEPTDAGYLLYIGPIVVDGVTTPAHVLVDTHDSTDFTDEQRLASSSLVTGWSMTLRSRPFPPGRTGRFTSGRPRYLPGVYTSGPESFLSIPVSNLYPTGCTPKHSGEKYATLCIADPSNSEEKGEYWVMVRDMAAEDSLAMFAHDGTNVNLNKYVCLKNETYAVFSWKSGNTEGSWGPVQQLPPDGSFSQSAPFAHAAIKACLENSGKSFYK